ncbi:hypothetical protein TSAR_009390 [Trichomalopsis sarcophagae]|uniref:Uncharacterized protein n=1 Tax=Trichomalopsis sarcophagae TaxID=543379 RepID=A0A232EGM0_9HYME|nr:hypothetical protein TSAR_009390 [Trichomalopsis sarcophagae]
MPYTYIAVRFGTIQVVEMILETGECDINEVSSFGETEKWKFCYNEELHFILSKKNVHFIYNELLPWNTPKICIPLLARGKVENQNINIEDELTFYPTDGSSLGKLGPYVDPIHLLEISAIISREARKARILIQILAPMIRPSEMREIIEGLVECSDLETVKFCLEIYPQKSVLCFTSGFTHALNEGNEIMIKLLLEYKVDYTTLENCHIPANHSALTAKHLDILDKLFELEATLDKYRV